MSLPTGYQPQINPPGIDSIFYTVVDTNNICFSVVELITSPIPPNRTWNGNKNQVYTNNSVIDSCENLSY